MSIIFHVHDYVSCLLLANTRHLLLSSCAPVKNNNDAQLLHFQAKVVIDDDALRPLLTFLRGQPVAVGCAAWMHVCDDVTDNRLSPTANMTTNHDHIRWHCPAGCTFLLLLHSME